MCKFVVDPTTIDNSVTIKMLEDAGMHVKIKHERPSVMMRNFPRGEIVYKYTPGAHTVAVVMNDEFGVIATARVHPKDSFCRKIGTKLALDRAIEMINDVSPEKWIDHPVRLKRSANAIGSVEESGESMG